MKNNLSQFTAKMPVFRLATSKADPARFKYQININISN